MEEERIKKLEFRISDLEGTVRHLERRLSHQFEEGDFTDMNACEEVLTVSDVANLLGLPRHIVYSKALAGEIPSFRIGRRYKFSRTKVLEWFEVKFDKTIDVNEFVEKYLQSNVLS